MAADAPDDASSLVEDLFWNPHASPRSVWALVATYPLLILGVYQRSAPLLATTLCSVVLNIRLSSPPETDAAWATRVVRGEQVWLERGVRSDPGSLSVVALGALVQLFTLRAAVNRQPGRTALGTVGSMATMLLFFQRMVELYDAHEAPDVSSA